MFCVFDCSVKEFKYDTGIANLGGRKLGAIAFNDPPYVYMYVDKTVNGVKAEFSPDSKSKQCKNYQLTISNQLLTPSSALMG